ncbi:hypothetical protein OOT46_24095 [Aquabacterium sp. A7-Y]|uniref:hypothetical protein n=1 Tax=Aquabacterium sp. A7-Y TaxID=1349605 RepID=UPI00223C9119|nr:hypothetical protein [Aquabacterium sp. A7-Y]MCW7540907.1 hypothetical protein [Aquabacterium sp. A7-Y]
MAKKIDRARIEAGRVELPKKLGFLIADKVEFNTVTDKDGEWTVEMSAGALQKLVKSRSELKALKAESKKAAALQAREVDAEKLAHEETRQALAKAERRIATLEKKLATPGEGAAAPKVAATPKAKKNAAKTKSQAGPEAAA